MIKRLRSVEKHINTVIPGLLYREIKEYMHAHKPNMWGEKTPTGYKDAILAATIYKDMEGVSYEHFTNHLSLGFHHSKRSWEHNVHLTRLLLQEWAKSTTELGSLEDWQASTHNIKIKKRVAGTCLWMDSSDFPLVKKKGEGRSSAYYSHKLGRRGRRYMFLRDGHGIIRRCWGGYSPKLYDGHWLEVYKEWSQGADSHSWPNRKRRYERTVLILGRGAVSR